VTPVGNGKAAALGRFLLSASAHELTKDNFLTHVHRYARDGDSTSAHGP
jgi:hypothetical protein